MPSAAQPKSPSNLFKESPPEPEGLVPITAGVVAGNVLHRQPSDQGHRATEGDGPDLILDTSIRSQEGPAPASHPAAQAMTGSDRKDSIVQGRVLAEEGPISRHAELYPANAPTVGNMLQERPLSDNPTSATALAYAAVEPAGLSNSAGAIHSSGTHPAVSSNVSGGSGIYASNPTALGQFTEATYPSILSTNPAPLRHSGHHSAPLLVGSTETHSIARLQDPIGPIQPIGRPRPSQHEQTVDHNGHSAQARTAHMPSHDRVLGSAALSSGDDEVIIPAPRRVSHSHNALGPSWPAGSSMSSSHWGTTFAATPAPIWGRSNLSPAAVHAWPAAGTSGQFIPHRFDVPAPLAEPFSARPQQQVARDERRQPL